MGEWGKGGSPKKESASTTGEVLETLHWITGIRKVSMAEKLGISMTGYRSYFEHDMRVDTFLKVVDALGWHLEVRPGATGMIQIRDTDKCETCEFRRFVEQTEGELIVDFYPEKKGVEI